MPRKRKNRRNRKKFQAGGHMHQQNVHIHQVGSGTTTGTSIYYPNSPESHPMAQTYEAGDHNHPNNTDATHRHNVLSHKHLSHNNGFWSNPHFTHQSDMGQHVDYTDFQTDNTHPYNMSGPHTHNQELHRHMQFPNADDTGNQIYSGMGQGPNAESYVSSGNHSHTGIIRPRPTPSVRGGAGLGNVPAGRGGGGRNRRRNRYRTGGKINSRRVNKKQQGGVLKGPSHARGGIPAVVGGTTPVELEGGEYIINAQTVSAVGTEYLDRLNSTATTYHQGGFSQGQLGHGSKYRKGGRVTRNKKRYQTGGGLGNPIIQSNLQSQVGQFVYKQTGQPYNGLYHLHQDGTYMIGAGTMGATHPILTDEIIIPTPGNNSRNNYKKGGKINNRKKINGRKKMARGGRTQRRRIPTRRKKQMGGMTNNCPPGQYLQGGQCVGNNGYRRGGKVNRGKRKLHSGGHLHTMPSAVSDHRHRVPIDEQFYDSSPPMYNNNPITRYATNSQGLGQTNRVRRRGGRLQQGGYVFHGTNTPYNGPVIQQGGNFYSTKSGTKEGSSRLLQMKRGGIVRRR